MEEISDITHEYGQRANGVLSSLDKFDSLSVLNLAIVYLELQSSFLGHCRGKIRLCQKLLSLQIWPRITIHDCAQRQSSINCTSHVSPLERVSLANQCCHDIGEPLPGLIGLNVLRITIEYNTMKPQQRKTQ